jgi:hypothetical protein
MKMIVALLCLVFSFHANAEESCGDITGVFKIDDASAIRLIQNNCESLKIAYGEIQEYGKITWYGEAVKAYLNTTSCDLESCVTSKVIDGAIELTNNKSWIGYVPNHGICDYDKDVYALTMQGNLSRKQKIYNCQDGFEGEVENFLVRMN